MGTKLKIRTVEHLANQLNFKPHRLIEIAENAESYYLDFNRNVKGKPRKLVMVKPPLATIQRRVLDNILSRLDASEFAYGAVKGRSILENAKEHANFPYIIKLDVKNFYPSIRFKKVYDFFLGQDCSPDVARTLTILTTRKYSLPLGTSTSPMLADQIVHGLDKRISGMARKAELNYTRYVDDITISGKFELDKFFDILIKIIRQEGLNVKISKLETYRPNDGKERIITGVRVHNGKISAPFSYVEALHHELNQAQEQSRHQKVEGDFDTKNQYRGRIGYVMWLDPKEGQKLLRIYRKVKWRHLEWAMQQGCS